MLDPAGARTGTTPYWVDSATQHAFSRLDHDDHVDVVIVGGGITGLTAAYFLTEAGRRVAVIERARCMQADTGHTTAHLTMVTDSGLTALVNRFGRSRAGGVWDAGLAAIDRIASTMREKDIVCGFEWVDGYLHSPGQDHRERHAEVLREEAALASDLGFDASFVEEVPLMGGPGIRYARQARFHPREYLAGLCQAIAAEGGRVYEQSDAAKLFQDPPGLSVNGRRLTCDTIVLATHRPITDLDGMMAPTLLQMKLLPHTSYVIAGRTAHGSVPDALFWDTATPYHYLRIERHSDDDVVMLGGEDHEIGRMVDTTARYQSLEQRLRAIVPGVQITHRWSGQVIETPDGLPYIGRIADHRYAATGFGGNGMTFGTLAAMIVTDMILGRENPWAELFDPARQ